jgi:hypothetical protein
MIMKVTQLLCILTLLIISFNTEAATDCNCWQTRDTTWSVVHFDGYGQNGGPGLPPLYRNDDWSTDTVTLPFNFCFYGDTITKLFINNNGNISFGSPCSTFTANSFPDTTFRMVAPIWSDVDTRDSILSGVVYFKIFSNYMVVQWDSVGYYDSHADRRNTYQLIISDGNTSPLPEQKNIGFCYKKMEWTTGDVSGGVGGLGGTPATVGVNYGDGVNYLQIGLYNDSTYNYDGPYGANDGVASLSDQAFAFNVCVNNFNVPPILSGQYLCDTIHICSGDTFIYNANFIAPEQLQNTTVTYSAVNMTGVSLVTTPGNQATVALTVIGGTPGIYTVEVIGTDDGTPAEHTSVPLIFDIQNCTTGISENVFKDYLVSPNPFTNKLNISIGQKMNVRVTDSFGKIICVKNNFETGEINTAEWSKGIYFINFSNDKYSVTEKFIKN